MAKNRGEFLVKFTDMLVDIGFLLSRIDVFPEVFPTERILGLTSLLYTTIIDFLQETIMLFQRKAVCKSDACRR